MVLSEKDFFSFELNLKAKQMTEEEEEESFWLELCLCFR
jgi:hypothetical protein